MWSAGYEGGTRGAEGYFFAFLAAFRFFGAAFFLVVFLAAFFFVAFFFVAFLADLR